MQQRQETQVQSLGWEDPLEEGMATRYSLLAWRIPGQRSLAGCSSGGCKQSDDCALVTYVETAVVSTLSGHCKITGVKYLEHRLT